ncbi:hypothetical protein JOM56_013546 [Amanita muscaria]
MNLAPRANNNGRHAALELVLSLQRRVLTRKALRSVVLTHFPRLLKYVIYLLVLLNVRSFPLAWHFRVFRPVFAVRARYLALRLRTLFLSRRQWEKEEDKWLDNLCPVGQDPFNIQASHHSWASLDDSDYNIHLSNSCYAKACDAARLRAALKMFPMFFRAGGHMALAATHFEFIKEIPMFASYEVRVTIGSWDQKWLYLVCKFVTKPSKKSKQTESRVDSRNNDNITVTLNSRPFAMGLNTPDENNLTLPSGTPAGTNAPPTVANTDTALDAVSTKLGEPRSQGLSNDRPRGPKVLLEPDGAILHAVAVSQGCFKIGRITVPPALALAINGFSVPPEEEFATYSPGNPPPSFLKAKEFMAKPLGGNPSRMRDFLKGGWRGVQGERWWEAALSGSIEEGRKKRLEVLNKLKTGLEDSR